MAPRCFPFRRRFAGLVLLLAGIGAVGTWWMFHDARGRPAGEVGDIHAGSVPGFGEAWLAWSELREGAAGLVIGQTNSRRGELGPADPDGWRELRVEREQDFRWFLRLGQPDREAGHLDGVASNRVTGRAEAFRLARAATVVGTRRETGLRLGRWGGGLAFRGSWPEWTPTNRVREAVQRWLRQESARVAEGFLHDSWRRTWDGLRRPSAANRWEIVRHWRWRAEGSDWVALEEERAADLGAGGSAPEWVGRNFRLGRGGLEEWRLGDLFGSDSGWVVRLEGLAQAALLRLGATGATRRGTAAGLIRADTPYVLLPGGIELIFAPFEAGSAAEGTYRVYLPATELAGLLRPEARRIFQPGPGEPEGRDAEARAGQ
ncbi:MAG: hypothetical protein ACKO3N_10330 [Verrucomicrobiota bacterium]